jgi:hypothetical protein
MAYQLTGAQFSGYLLRQCRDIANRNPRFREALGAVSFPFNNRMQFADAEVIVSDFQADGARQSPDYYRSTQLGRAIVAKVGGHEGKFIAWANEVDTTGNVLDAGVYYINVDWVAEEAIPAASDPKAVPRTGADRKVPAGARVGDVGFTVQKHKWREGCVGAVESAAGSVIQFRDGIDAQAVTISDLEIGNPVPVLAGSSSLQLLGNAQSIRAVMNGTVVLTPITDFWVERDTKTTIIPTTVFGTQTAFLPANLTVTKLVDQDGDILRPGIDYTLIGDGAVQFAAWTVAGSTISAVGTSILDPSIAGNCINPENILSFNLLPGETLDQGEVTVCTQDGVVTTLTVGTDGSVALPTPLPTGGWCRWEVRILTGEYRVTGRRNAIQQTMIPGLWVAISDEVEAGDQAVVLVSPTLTQTYMVYGATEGVSCTVEVRANDPLTATDLASAIKRELMIYRREGMQNDGVFLLQASFSGPGGAARDNSGTASTHVASLGLSGTVEWREYRPLITRVTHFDISTNPEVFPRQVTDVGRFQALGSTGFIPDYR